MKRALVLAMLLVPALAPASSLVAPAGWSSDPPAAVSMSNKLADVPHFGGLRSIVTTEVYRTTGCSLFVTRTSASVAGLDPDNRNRAATHELNDMLLGMTRNGGKPVSDAVKLAELDDKRGIQATHRWHDEGTGIAVNGRIVVVADAQQMVAVTGECMLAAGVAKDVEAACVAALATLDPGIAAGSRVELRVVKDTAAFTPPPTAGAPPSMGSAIAPTGPASTGPSLVDSGERPSLPPMQIKQDKAEPDRRPMYVGFGLVVLALIFWWNRKNREKLEREYEKRVDDSGDKPADQSEDDQPAKPGADRDGDDLHAAAAESDQDGGTKESKS